MILNEMLILPNGQTVFAGEQVSEVFLRDQFVLTFCRPPNPEEVDWVKHLIDILKWDGKFLTRAMQLSRLPPDVNN